MHVWKRLAKWDPEKAAPGVSVQAFARTAVRQGLIDELRKHKIFRRVAEDRAPAPVPIALFQEDEEAACPRALLVHSPQLADLLAAERRANLHRAVHLLEPQEAAVVMGSLEDEKVAEIARRVKVSFVRVYEILGAAKTKLAEVMEA